MREGWKITKLSEVLDIQNGYAFDSKKFSDNGDMPLIRIRDLKVGINTATKYSGEYDAKYVVRAGELLVGMDGEFACHEWRGSDALLNQRVCRLQNFSSNLLPRFLFYGINKFLKDIEDVTTFTTVKHLSARQIKSIEFPLPPIPEQKRIVAILDEAFAGIATAVANTEKNLANARELFESYLNSIFTERGKGWVDFAISDVADVVSGYSFNSSDFKKGNPTYAIKIANVGVRKFVLESEKSLPAEFAKEFSRFQIPEGSIVIALTRSVIADGLKVAIVPKEFDGALLNQRVAALKIDNRCMRDYVFFFLCTRFVSDYVKKMANTLMQPNLSINDLRKLPVPVAPITRLRHIIEDIEALRSEVKNIESIYQLKLTALAELIQSLLKKAFSGELTGNEGAADTILKEEEVA